MRRPEIVERLSPLQQKMYNCQYVFACGLTGLARHSRPLQLRASYASMLPVPCYGLFIDATLFSKNEPGLCYALAYFPSKEGL